ncbi:hypothetical protein QJS04_geneDACA005649 [Acorus gramineus]|uniref:Phytocyanin domain-containing protein n=1 Tax=Acorus gramineus TaxID=55184 RepID=A0AAV9A521_ACOGR|nr:hypothetical protein QJS04_geneDACA005649 [Acorus gramineus]
MAKALIWSVVVVVLMAFAASVSAVTTHDVGGSTGWTIPSDSKTYTNWVAGFTFPTGSHNVMEVSKSDYDSCTTTAPIGGTKTTGPATLSLSTAGMHYYICGFPQHCSAGQKLSINVLSSTPSKVPSPPPSTTAVAGGPTSTPPPSTGGGPNSASSPLHGFGVVALSSVVLVVAGHLLF